MLLLSYVLHPTGSCLCSWWGHEEQRGKYRETFPGPGKGMDMKECSLRQMQDRFVFILAGRCLPAGQPQSANTRGLSYAWDMTEGKETSGTYGVKSTALLWLRMPQGRDSWQNKQSTESSFSSYARSRPRDDHVFFGR